MLVASMQAAQTHPPVSTSLKQHTLACSQGAHPHPVARPLPCPAAQLPSVGIPAPPPNPQTWVPTLLPVSLPVNSSRYQRCACPTHRAMEPCSRQRTDVGISYGSQALMVARGTTLLTLVSSRSSCPHGGGGARGVQGRQGVVDPWRFIAPRQHNCTPCAPTRHPRNMSIPQCRHSPGHPLAHIPSPPSRQRPQGLSTLTQSAL